MKQLGTRPRLSSSRMAPSWVKPMVLGISTISGPLLMTSRMVGLSPSVMAAPAAGSWVRTVPAGALSL